MRLHKGIQSALAFAIQQGVASTTQSCGGDGAARAVCFLNTLRSLARVDHGLEAAGGERLQSQAGEVHLLPFDSRLSERFSSGGGRACGGGSYAGGGGGGGGGGGCGRTCGTLLEWSCRPIGADLMRCGSGST